MEAFIDIEAAGFGDENEVWVRRVLKLVFFCARLLWPEGGPVVLSANSSQAFV